MRPIVVRVRGSGAFMRFEPRLVSAPRQRGPRVETCRWRDVGSRRGRRLAHPAATANARDALARRAAAAGVRRGSRRPAPHADRERARRAPRAGLPDQGAAHERRAVPGPVPGGARERRAAVRAQQEDRRRAAGAPRGRDRCRRTRGTRRARGRHDRGGATHGRGRRVRHVLERDRRDRARRTRHARDEPARAVPRDVPSASPDALAARADDRVAVQARICSAATWCSTAGWTCRSDARTGRPPDGC